MGWTDSHLHEFRVCNPRTLREEIIGIPMYDDLRNEPIRPGWRIPIRSILKKPGTKASYAYDFGDGWVHVVEFEKTVPLQKTAPCPACIGGRRKCPPEDCGGVWSYEDLLQIMADPGHPEFAETLRWLGDGFDPADFSPGQVEFTNPRKRLRRMLGKSSAGLEPDNTTGQHLPETGLEP
jgi:hypothetical protein